ncbi:MAG: hypothetical protein ACRDGA_04145, partial [Bacteroidota bacterium]
VIEREVQPPEYSHTVVAVCPDCRRGQLERTYRDSADPEEIFDQTEWYLLDEASMDRFRQFIRQNSMDGSFRARSSSCPAPLSPQCLCGVHWQLTEAARRLEPLSDDEMQRLQGVALASFSCTEDGFRKFARSN